jgi:hypothetical protein
MERSVETRNSPSSSFDEIDAVLAEFQEALSSSRSRSDASPFSFEGDDSSEAKDSTATPPSTSPPGTPPGSRLATMAPTIPRIGGSLTVGTVTHYFSGGGLHDANKATRPKSTHAVRPELSDLRTKMRVEDACQRPLEETHRIDDGDSSPITFADWMNQIQRHMTLTGLDSIAYVLVPTTTTPTALTAITTDFTTLKNTTDEYCLFTHWGSIKLEYIVAWDAAIKSSPCPVDNDNDTYGREFLRGSVGNSLRDQIDRDLDIDCSAARMLYFIINKLQTVSAMSARELVDELKTKRLSAIPGCNVKELKAQLTDLCKKIEGLGPTFVPIDLSHLVCLCFDTTDVKLFDLHMLGLQNDLDTDLSAHSWRDIVDKANTKFDSLRLSKRWPPLQGGTDSKAVASGFAVQLEQITKQLHQLSSSRNQGNNGSHGNQGTGGPPSSSNGEIICNYCHKPGHKVRDSGKITCPVLLAKQAGGNSTGKPASSSNSGGGTDTSNTSWNKVCKLNPPKEGESESKTISFEGDQVKAKFCRRCKRWTKGAKAHYTAEHRTKAEIEASGASVASGNSGTIGGFLGQGVSFVGNLGYSGELAGQDPYATDDFLQQLYEEYTSFTSNPSTDIVPPDQVSHVIPVRPLSDRPSEYAFHDDEHPKGQAGRD